ncbi:carotenoid ester lipase [Coprinopsis sp. MPI-PUGE-AT-0042]|nr:carotenoid ester lipase [Coprinopsis sp. MPI-PUGE-AT-0042]
MPFAAPPTGQLRFAPPAPPIPFTDVKSAAKFGPACPQQSSPGPTPGQSEDCLTINVVRPVDVPLGRKLPVVVWIYGGGFQVGEANSDGVPLVERSLALKQPVIYVAANYRVSAYGFLGGKEAKAAGVTNVGILDQDAALKWIQQNIGKFGGDKGKVIIWGESAGAVSVGTHLVRNPGPPKLFHGAVMQSGGPVFFDKTETFQWAFDELVGNTGCTGSSDKIACLRGLPFEKLQAGVALAPGLSSYTSLVVAFGPSVDEKVIVRNPQASIKKGLYARVPLVIGNVDDEGTLFSFGNQNITTDAQFREYVNWNYYPTATKAQIDEIARVYPDDITQGSPFDTGTANAITPQFKRLSAFQGDWLFQAPRRFFCQYAYKRQPTWSYLFKRGKQNPVIGASHASDIPEFFGTDNSEFVGTDALISLVYTGNPNTSNKLSKLSNYRWRQYSPSTTEPSVLIFGEIGDQLTTAPDNQRVEAFKVLTEVSLATLGGNL